MQHQLSDILFLTVCAVICGAEGWDEIEDFGHAKLDFLRQHGDFEAGVPSHDTLARVMALAITQALKARLPSRLMVVEPNIDELPVSLEGAKFASIDAALAEADILVLLVDHKAFKKVDAERLAGRHLVDTRGVWTGQNRRRSDVQLARESFEPAEACPGQ